MTLLWLLLKKESTSIPVEVLPRAMPSTSMPIQLPASVTCAASLSLMPTEKRRITRPRMTLPPTGEGPKTLAGAKLKPTEVP